MISSVTIQGSDAQIITVSYDTTANYLLAEQIAAQINSSVADGTLVTSSDTMGPPPTPLDGVTGAYVQTTDSTVSLPSDYTTDIVIKPGAAMVFGSGAANEMILSDISTSLSFTAAGGSGSVVAGGGNDRLVVPGSTTGDWTLYTGDGNDVIQATGTGNATIGAGGGNNSILLGSGQDVVTLTGDDSIMAGSGAETVDATGAHSVYLQGESSQLLFAGGLGGATILGGSGSDTYFGSLAGRSGPQVVKGGTAGNNELFAGIGPTTLSGGGSNDQLYAYGTVDQMLIAGSGNETLSGAFAQGNNTFTAGSGQDLIIGGTGADTFVGGSGQSTIMAGASGQMYQFINHAAGGTEFVTGVLDPKALQINLQGYAPNAVTAALASQTVANGTVSISLSDGTKISFSDVSSLQRSNFV